MKRFLLLVAIVGLPSLLLAQRQLLIMKNGKVRASFMEGTYIHFVLKKNHRHAEGHIVELGDFSMITSNDTVKFKDILKINIKKHREQRGFVNTIGRFLFLGGIFYFLIDQGNVALGINSQNDTPAEWLVPIAVIGVGAAMILIRPRYLRINGIQYLMAVDYKSPFYQH